MNAKKFDHLIEEKQNEFYTFGETDLYSYVESVRKNKENTPEVIELSGKYTRAQLRKILDTMELVDKFRGML